MRTRVRCLVLIVAAGLLGACTPGTGGSTPAPTTIIRTSIVPVTPSASVSVVPPISTGPTKAATASVCPLLDQQAAAKKVGMRLDRITVLRSGGKTVGCRFYALQHPNASCDETCLQGEHLPGAHQPAIEIETYRYPSAKDAYNGFVRISKKEGHNIAQTHIVGQAPGLCFQTHFYPKDHGTDWACAFSKGKLVGLVRTVVTSQAELNAVLVARAAAAKV